MRVQFSEKAKRTKVTEYFIGQKSDVLLLVDAVRMARCNMGNEQDKTAQGEEQSELVQGKLAPDKTEQSDLTQGEKAKDSVVTLSAGEALAAGVEGRRAAKFTFSSDVAKSASGSEVSVGAGGSVKGAGSAGSGTATSTSHTNKRPNQKLGMLFAFAFAIVAAIVLAVFIALVMVLV